MKKPEAKLFLRKRFTMSAGLLNKIELPDVDVDEKIWEKIYTHELNHLLKKPIDKWNITGV